jgi:hypothetical protein
MDGFSAVSAAFNEAESTFTTAIGFVREKPARLIAADFEELFELTTFKTNVFPSWLL